MIENVYPLSPLQEGIYYHWLLDPQSSVYVDQLIYTTQGEMDIPKMQESYRKLRSRHAILRTFFTQEFGDKALQVVLKQAPDTFAYHDCTLPDRPTAEQIIKADLAKGFNLLSGSQMRLSVLKIGEDVYQFLWSFHHILLDGWCVSILIKDFYQFYKGLLAGVEPVMEPVFPYVNYIQWLGKLDQAQCVAYWKKYLEGYDTLSTLPKLPNPQGLYNLKETHVMLPQEQRDAMRKLCADMGVTENIFFQTMWGLLLGIYNNTNDVVFGAVVSGRPPEVEGIEKMIGLFINTVPVRIKAAEGTTVRSLLRSVQDDAIQGTRYHYTQLGQIQAETGAGPNLLDHILVYENYPLQDIIEQGMESEKTGASDDIALVGLTSVEQTNYGLNLILMPGDQFVIRFNHNTYEYDETHITLIKNNLLSIFEQVLANPDMLVSTVQCLAPEEKEKILNEFNNTKVPYPSDKTVVQLFQGQAATTPDKLALVFAEAAMTYEQLNGMTNQVAHFLRNTLQVQPGDIVGIQLPRSHWQILAILGTLKAGAAYLPIDVDFPPERVANMLADCNTKIVINEQTLQQGLAELGIQPIENLEPLSNPDSLMYIMYTSGSTGVPKGVQIQHRAAVRLVKHTNFVPLDESCVLLSTGAVAFDATTFEYWGMLLNGGTLVLCGTEVLLDEAQLAATIQKHKVNMMWFTAGWLHQLIDKSPELFAGLQTILAGGDKLSPVHIAKLQQLYPQLTIINGYGPTENTTFSLTYKIEEITGPIPIGKPINNTVAYILGQQQQLLPIGAVGEICVGGDGLALGYLNQPELTATQFIDNPFLPGERLYKTGDLGKWQVDGNIAFIGRRDQQVKIRGYRIELGEIEAVLRKYSGIEDAVVVARQDSNGDKELIAYITGSDTMSDATVLGSYLGGLLPHYMVPAYFVQLPELPLNANGKVDRKLLPAPEGVGISSGVEYIEPRNETEEKLLKMWQSILGKEKISVKDNFFAIGGHSLKATKLVSLINKDFGMKLPLPVLFSNPTIENIAAEITKTQLVNSDNLEPDTDDLERISL